MNSTIIVAVCIDMYITSYYVICVIHCWQLYMQNKKATLPLSSICCKTFDHVWLQIAVARATFFPVKRPKSAVCAAWYCQASNVKSGVGQTMAKRISYLQRPSTLLYRLSGSGHSQKVSGDPFQLANHVDGEMEGGYEAESWLRVRLGNPRKYSLDPLGSCTNPTRLKVTATPAGFSGKKTFTFPSSSTRRAVVAVPFGCGSDKRSASLLSKWPRIPQGGAEHEQNPKAQVTKKYSATIGLDISL